MADKRHPVIRNIEKVHVTPFAEERIRHNIPDCELTPLELCRQIILDPETTFVNVGKNWNIGNKQYTMSLNTSTYVVITARRRKPYIPYTEAQAKDNAE